MTSALGTDDPIVHYMTISHGCVNAIQVMAHPAEPLRDLFVLMPGGHTSVDNVAYDNDVAEPAYGTWHFRSWCPALGKHAPGRAQANAESSGRPESVHPLAADPPRELNEAERDRWVQVRGRGTSWGTADVLLDDGNAPAVTGRALVIGQGTLGNDHEFIDAARSAKAADPVWIADGGGFVVAVIVPAEEYHPAGTCCCKNCPWNGHHEEKDHA